MTVSPKSNRGGQVFQVKVSLRGVKPPIWRRILVNAENPLDVLHCIVQDVMGWTNTHLYAFEKAVRSSQRRKLTSHSAAGSLP